jgi:serine/threonine protein kinase
VSVVHLQILADKAQGVLNQGEFAVKKIKAQSDSEEVAEHWEREVKALRMMNELNQRHIVRFITAFRRLKESGEEHYVMFEWAAGGNLRHLWKTMPTPEFTGNMVKLVIIQLLGLSQALEAAHNLRSEATTDASYRHGDLKPENILVFPSVDTTEDPIGTLKIGDWGEAKYHGKVTAIRPSRTLTKFGTRRYEAPEVEIGVPNVSLGQSAKRRSRLGDLWAMGCITLEFIVWLLYGMKGLDLFNHDVSGETFYQISITNGKQVAHVHSMAIRWMEHMAKNPACAVGATALGDLLELVQTRLLVVNLPQGLGSTFFVDHKRSEPGPQSTSFGSYKTNMDDTTSIFEEIALSDNPTFTLTPAETNGAESEEKTPVQRGLREKGPTRCHAAFLMDSLYHISTEYEFGYWVAERYEPEAPTDLAYTDVDASLSEVIQPLDNPKRASYSRITIKFHWLLLMLSTGRLCIPRARRESVEVVS